MPDNLTKEQRSYCMSRIRSKNTKPERLARPLFKDLEYQPDKVLGNPDFIDWKNRAVIFIDGCFWHKCPEHFKYPKSNRKYWLPKLRRNAVRSIEIELAYRNSGWKIVRIWEHELKK